MSVYRIEIIAKHLAEHGPCTTRELADALGVTTEAIGDAMKHTATQGRWGIIKLGLVEDHAARGKPPTRWAIDERKYKAYLARRRDMPWIYKRIAKPGPPPKPKAPPKPKPPPKPKAPTIKEPKVDYNRKIPVYNGPHRTVWQSSSPYYKEQAHEHASSSPGATTIQQPAHPTGAQPLLPTTVGAAGASPR